MLYYYFFLKLSFLEYLPKYLDMYVLELLKYFHTSHTCAVVFLNRHLFILKVGEIGARVKFYSLAFENLLLLRYKIAETIDICETEKKSKF